MGDVVTSTELTECFSCPTLSSIWACADPENRRRSKDGEAH